MYARRGIDARPPLDRLDTKILAALQNDGRLSNLKLAGVVGLSPTPCLQRVKRLESAGFIQAYGATIDIRRVVPYVTVHTDVTLRRRTIEQTQEFERYVHNQPFVTECYLVSGGFDYVLKVTARDIDHYREIIEDMLTAGVGVERISSFVAIQSIKQARGVPLALLQPAVPVREVQAREVKRG